MKSEHNSTGMIDGAALRRYVYRIVQLHEERDIITGDINTVYEEAQDAGLKAKYLRQLVREARMEPEVRDADLAAMDALRHALGQFSSTPLGESALRAELEVADRAALQRANA